MELGLFEGSLSVGPGSSFGVWLFGVHSLQWDALLILDAVGRALVLPQFNVPGLVDSPRETLTFQRSGRGMGWGRGVWGVVGKEGGDL